SQVPGMEVIPNTVWWNTDETHPQVEAGLNASTAINLERGVKDVLDGSSMSGFLAFIDRRHANGVGVRLGDYYGNNHRFAVLEAAVYYLINTGLDFYQSGYNFQPSNYWSALYDLDLGNASGARYSWNGLLRRDFAKGLVLVNPPHASTVNANLPATMK